MPFNKNTSKVKKQKTSSGESEPIEPVDTAQTLRIMNQSLDDIRRGRETGQLSRSSTSGIDSTAKRRRSSVRLRNHLSGN